MNSQVLYKELEANPEMRRLHYLLLVTTEDQLGDFYYIGARAFNHQIPVMMTIEADGMKERVLLGDVPGVPHTDGHCLNWLCDWALARKIMVKERIALMEKHWPELAEMKVDYKEDKERKRDREFSLRFKLRKVCENALARLKLACYEIFVNGSGK